MAEPKQSLTIIKPHKVGSYSFDVTFFERHQADIDITEQPIELGADITDHAFVKPLRLTVGGAVADVPLRLNPSFDTSSSNARSSSAYQTILKSMYTRQMIRVQTGLANYPNMVMESLEAAQDKSTPDVFNFIMTLRQINVVSVQTVSVPAEFLKPGTTQSLASPTVNNGAQLTVNPTPTQVSVLQGWVKLGYPTSKP